MIAGKLANMRQGERNDLTSIDVRLSQPQAAALLNVSVPSVQRAKQVQQKAIPEVIEKVSQGNLAVSVAAVIAIQRFRFWLCSFVDSRSCFL